MGIPAVHWPNTAIGNSDGIYFDEAPCLFEGGTKVSFGIRCYRTHSPTSSTDSRLISIADGTAENDHSLMCSQISGTAFRVRIRAGATTSTHISATGAFQANTYYDWVVTYDGATLRLYRNGAELTSGAFPAALSGTLGRDAGMRLGIGNNGVSEDRPFGGFLADPFIDWHVWEPERAVAYHDGEDLAKLVVTPELSSRLDDWPTASQERGIPNLAAGSLLGRGVTQGQVEGAIMPGIERRAFVQVVFPDLPVLDQAAGGLGLVRMVAETTQGAEGRLPPRALARLLGETAVASEALLSTSVLARLQAETARIAESAVESLAALIVRAVAETLQGTEALAMALGLARAPAENTQLAEAMARVRVLTRPVAETAGLSEAPLAGRVLARLVAEVCQSVEIRLRVLGATRIAAETANPTEAPAHVKNFTEGAKMAIKLVGRAALMTPFAALRRTVISLTGKIEN